ncbi:MAG: hypothetical protein HYY57_03305 [Candidatus Omnitrophica bacterium]|nr:hypothetical protein [Candidatus Omnitrophota bacterium]
MVGLFLVPPVLICFANQVGLKGGRMYRRLSFILTLCGLVLVVLALATVLRRDDLISCTVGLGLIILGTFAGIDSTGSPKR